MSRALGGQVSQGSLVVILTLLCSCGSDDYDGALGGRRLLRTPLTGNWVVKDFPYSGLSAQIPSGTDLQWVRDSGRAYIGMHAAVWPLWSPGDPQLLLQITLKRMSREEFEERKAQMRRSGMYKESDEDDRARLDWRVAWHDTIERFDSGGYTYYKYEFECPDQSVVRMHVELVNLRRNGVAVHEAEDEAAIRRILSSVECIDQVPMPERPE